MRAVIIALLAVFASTARAEPPGLVIPVPLDRPLLPTITTEAPSPVAKTRSYRWQVVAVDVVAVGSLALALRDRSDDWGYVGLATYGLGAPIAHAASGHGGRALGSLGLRVGLPLVAGFLGSRLETAPQCEVSPGGALALCDGTFPSDGVAKGLAVGAIAAMALDAWLIAKPEPKHRRMWSPNAAASQNRVSVGVSGAF